MKELIGYYILEEDREMRTQYEVASWYEIVLVKAGKYPIYQYDRSYLHCYVHFYGECVSSNFTSEFGGVPFGSKIDKEVGKTIEVSQQYYDYSIAKMAYNGKIELVDGIKATKEREYSEIFEEEYDKYSLVRQ